jgi:hypothetical protein
MMRISADNFRSCAQQSTGGSPKQSKDRFEKMGTILKSAINENPVPSLAEVARRLGYSYTAIVQRHEPSLCKRLMERRRVYIAKRRADLKGKQWQRSGRRQHHLCAASADAWALRYRLCTSISRQWRAQSLSGAGALRPKRPADVNWPVCGVHRLGKHQNRKLSAKTWGNFRIADED